jgi:hypothetical protein
MRKLAFLLLFVSLPALSELSAESRNLAWCEGVYIYYAQYFQIKNNEGAAKNLLFRSSRVVAANMLLNMESGKVSGEKVGQFKEVRKNMKSMFDSNPEGGLSEVSKCDASVQSTIAKVKSQNQTWNGQGFDVLQQSIMDKYLSTLGFR